MSEPAFPSTEAHPAYDFPQHFHGMSMRDWFAGQAVVAVAGGYRNPYIHADAIARDAYCLADAMMAERAKIV